MRLIDDVAASDGGRAVDVFARFHDRDDAPDSGWYRARIPTSLPTAGSQFAFEVDLDACTGCKACVVACRSLNGLDGDEVWRQVGTFESTPRINSTNDTNALSFAVTVTTACHHCADPACLRGCPVNAYEKDVITGAVLHLDDQCIGCSYCTMTCPYEVPSFNQRLGIVRKCDMCRDRLVVGEAPACVQGCPNSAIRITTVTTESITSSAVAPGAVLVPGAAPSLLSLPSTRFVRNVAAAPVAVDGDVSFAPSHRPLVAMLVLSQLGAGASVAAMLLALTGTPTTAAGASAVAMLAGTAGVAASFAHLGRPHLAWRVVIGLGHSWLSREAVLLGGFAALSVVARLAVLQERAVVAASIAAGAVGVGAVFSSCMVYGVTGRAWWSTPRVLVRFFATTAMFAAALLTIAMAGALAAGALVALGAATAATVLPDEQLMRTRPAVPSLARTSRLLRLVPPAKRRARIALGVAGVVGAALASVSSGVAGALVGAASVLALAGSAWIERSLFFTAVSPDSMPGWHRDALKEHDAQKARVA